jgi:Ser/Thr protein kinase RdoA (MazF antagonist)
LFSVIASPASGLLDLAGFEIEDTPNPLMADSSENSEYLHGGRQTEGVVRIGQTVRRPPGKRSHFVVQLLRHLEARGFGGAPRYLGRDAEDRDVFTYLSGEVPAELGEFSGEQLSHAARLLRSFHDATEDFEGRVGQQIVCHGDASPCNCVFLNGLPYALIDFDEVHPGTRAEDLGYAAWLWLDIGNDDIPANVQCQRLLQFFVDYGANPSISPVAAVMDAQVRHRSNSSLPLEIRRWSAHCLEWMQRQNWK